MAPGSAPDGDADRHQPVEHQEGDEDQEQRREEADRLMPR